MSGACFHCGLPLPAASAWAVHIDGVRQAMCCPGCEAVAQTIVDSGCTDYYRTRQGFAAAGDDALPPTLPLYDTQEALARFATDDGAQCSEATFSVEGIRCAACVWLIERRLAQVPGLLQVNLNVSTERLHVRWDREICKPSDIMAAVRAIGYVALPFDAARHAAQLQRAGKTLFRQLFIAGLSMMQVMMYAVPAYMAGDGTMEPDMAALLRWASLLLTLPAVLYSARPFFAGAWSNLRSRMPGMDVPVALGIAAAFGGSVVATFRGHGDVYFDSVTMFIFLLLCSRYLELLARRRAASALETLQHAIPASASRLEAWPSRESVLVPAAQLRVGDLILVRPGEAVAADGLLVDGSTTLDVSLLTGESLPQAKRVGDSLPGGAVNAGQAIVVRVLRGVADSTLSGLLKLVERAGQGKPKLTQWADHVAAWFVATLLVFAVAVFVAWQWFDPARAWPIAIAVLVVSCPCALSLATPSALAAATERLVRQGVLVVQPHVLETLHRITHIVFDKTGTLTEGKPVLQQTETFDALSPQQCLRLAASLEASSAHPLALALLAAQEEQGGLLHAIDIECVAGQGLEGIIDGVAYRIGNAAWVRALSGTAEPAGSGDAATPVFLGCAGRWLARFDLVDQVRPEAAAVVAQFRAAGKQVVLLSGDRQAATQRVAAQLGIAVACGEHLPQQKVEYVQRLQQGGAVVAMVGDGINDVAVLRAADVSFAMGCGAALAQTHADAVLLSGRLSSLRDAMQAAAQTMAVVRQNLWWATLYNVTAIPAAAFGWLDPWVAAIGMSVSSAVVVANALRLRRVPKVGRHAMPVHAIAVEA